MSSIESMNDNVTAAALAGEAEFKRAMKAINDDLIGHVNPETTAKTALSAMHILNDSEVKYRPAIQQ